MSGGDISVPISSPVGGIQENPIRMISSMGRSEVPNSGGSHLTGSRRTGQEEEEHGVQFKKKPVCHISQQSGTQYSWAVEKAEYSPETRSVKISSDSYMSRLE